MSALENYYNSLQNIVLRDTNGNPSIFVRHPKQKSSDFSNILPETTHPAFICQLNNGMPVEDPAILIGKYEDSIKNSTSPFYSLPYQAPHMSDLTIPAIIERSKYFDVGTNTIYRSVSTMTIADYGLLMLIAQKYILEGKGNPCEGNSYGMIGENIIDTAWRAASDSTHAKQYYIGDKVGCLGYIYECLQDHLGTDTSNPFDKNDMSKSPEKRPDLWKKLYRAGGVPTNLANVQGGLTLTGSGPLDWYLLHDPALEADLVGNAEEVVQGFRLNKAEVNIIPYNLIANPNNNLSLSDDSSAWRAILPHINDTGYDLVEPGTEDTVHIDRRNGALTFIGGDPSTSFSTTAYNCQFYDIKADETTLPQVPSILYELGLLPLPGCRMPGLVQFHISNDIRYTAIGRPYGMGPMGLGGKQMLLSSTNTDRIGSRSRAREITVF